MSLELARFVSIYNRYHLVFLSFDPEHYIMDTLYFNVKIFHNINIIQEWFNITKLFLELYCTKTDPMP